MSATAHRTHSEKSNAKRYIRSHHGPDAPVDDYLVKLVGGWGYFVDAKAVPVLRSTKSAKAVAALEKLSPVLATESKPVAKVAKPPKSAEKPAPRARKPVAVHEPVLAKAAADRLLHEVSTPTAVPLTGPAYNAGVAVEMTGEEQKAVRDFAFETAPKAAEPAPTPPPAQAPAEPTVVPRAPYFDPVENAEAEVQGRWVSPTPSMQEMPRTTAPKPWERAETVDGPPVAADPWSRLAMSQLTAPSNNPTPVSTLLSRTVRDDAMTTTGLRIQKDRPERNGVRRMSAGSVGDKLWTLYDGVGRLLTLDQAKELAKAADLNTTSAAIALYEWRRFNGFSKPGKA